MFSVSVVKFTGDASMWVCVYVVLERSESVKG